VTDLPRDPIPESLRRDLERIEQLRLASIDFQTLNAPVRSLQSDERRWQAERELGILRALETLVAAAAEADERDRHAVGIAERALTWARIAGIAGILAVAASVVAIILA
jgi:hypothetical protein